VAAVRGEKSRRLKNSSFATGWEAQWTGDGWGMWHVLGIREIRAEF